MNKLALMSSALLATGCASNCPAPQSMDGVQWAVFANLEKANPNADADDPLGHYGSPANGDSVWAIHWGDVDQGPIKVEIDGQLFNGQGDWDAIECGYFDVSFDGTYVSEAGTSHVFAAEGTMVQFLDQLEGVLNWAEGWASDDMLNQGDLRGNTSVRGVARRR